MAERYVIEVVKWRCELGHSHNTEELATACEEGARARADERERAYGQRVDDESKTFGRDEFIAYCKERGLKQAEIARRLDMSANNVGARLVRRYRVQQKTARDLGKSKVSVATLMRIAESLPENEHG